MLGGGFLSDKEPRQLCFSTALAKTVWIKTRSSGWKERVKSIFHHCIKYSLGIGVHSLEFQSEFCLWIRILFEALYNN